MTLHNDRADSVHTMPDGRIIRNLSDDEYQATYADGTPHEIPADVLAAAEAQAAQ